MVRGYAFLLIPLLLGYLLGKTKFLPEATSRALNFFVINIALPATVLISIKNITLSYDLLIPAAAQWVSLAISALLVMAVSRLFGFSRLITGTMLLVVPLGNTAFLGLSIIPVFLGREAIPYGVMYDQLGSFLALATYGAAIAGAYGKGNGLTVRRLVVRVVLFPPFIFLVVGFLIRDYVLPNWLSEALAILSRGLVPAAMLAIGLHLSVKVGRELFKPLVSALLIRLAIVPVLIMFGLALAGLSGLAAEVAVMQAAMPSMITAAVLASDKGLEKRLATSIVSVGLVISLVTLPLMAYAIEVLLS